MILFDGDCNFCNGTVLFIIDRDPEHHYQFASLESEAGKRILEKHHVPQETNSFIYIDHDQWYSKSTAALHVCKNLTGSWKALYAFIIIPKPIRDFFYNIFAANRYKWFGKQNSCRLPSPDDQKRFL